MIERDGLIELLPHLGNPDQWITALNKWLEKYEINTGSRITAFMAQCCHESAGLTALSENLNYSAIALTATWPKRFPAEIAKSYARKPEKIANRAYANRMGNGPEESGDGWRFRGAGVIQLTGCDNHAAFSRHAEIPLAAVPSYLRSADGAVRSACWFWQEHGCNELADVGDYMGITRSINGGFNGMSDRLKWLKIVQNVFDVRTA